MNNPSKKFFIGLIATLATILIIMAVILLVPSLGLATPKITWTPSKISETVSPLESKSIVVSFTSSENINNVAVRVVPELQSYLQTQPSIFSSIQAGITVNLTLAISIPADASLGNYDGTIQLKSTGKSAKTYAKPLPVTLYIWKSLEDPILPYTLKYPGNWRISIGDNGFVDIVGQVTSSIPTAPGDMAGTCKISITHHDNSEMLSLSDWLQRAEKETGALPSLSSVPITIGGITGIMEVIEEIGLTTTVYLPKGNRILSFELLCGDDAQGEGEIIFLRILDSVVLR